MRLFFSLSVLSIFFGFSEPVLSAPSSLFSAIGPDSTNFIVINDTSSFVTVSGTQKSSLDSSGLTIQATRNTNDEDGKVFKSLNVKVVDNVTGKAKDGFVFDELLQISFGYQADPNGKISNGTPGTALVSNLPDTEEAVNALSVYWFNGKDWIKLGAAVNGSNREASILTRHSGSFQLRLVQQTNIQNNAVFPRTITPNGDGINDKVFFFFENKNDASVQGTLYDFQSAQVAEVRVSDVVQGNTTVVTWDGMDDSGTTVQGGIYFYKIKVGDQTFTGTVAVAR